MSARYRFCHVNTSAVDSSPPESSSATALSRVETESLSVLLKTRTAFEHARVEELLGLPFAIRDRPDYERWLSRFLGFYEPLESAIDSAGRSAFDAVARTEDFAPRKPVFHSHRLIDDLASLGVDTLGIPRVGASALPVLATSAHAAGSHYVLMGATLGGRHILRGLAPLLRAELGAATRFLEGGGASTGSEWIAYRDSLDELGRRYPDRRGDVVASATGTFAALHQWFVPFCDQRDRSR